MEKEIWVPVTFTHIEYPKGDTLGMILAWFSLLPSFTVISFIPVIVLRRDLTTIFFFMGMFVNEGVNQVLKRVIAEPRPSRTASTVQWSQYGMPSAHSQFAGYFAMFVVLLFYVRISVVTFIIPLAKIWKHVLAAVTVLVSLAICYSRHYLKYHTEKQICAGFLVGLAIGAVWFIILEKFAGPYFPIIASMPICEMLLIKDYSLIPNTLWCEYHCIKTEMRSRAKKYIRPE
ncbi:hypothetical protein ACHWQZ_G016757 [Mnemiopsis leidyi]